MQKHFQVGNVGCDMPGQFQGPFGCPEQYIYIVTRTATVGGYLPAPTDCDFSIGEVRVGRWWEVGR